jgi:hypothetical protein
MYERPVPTLAWTGLGTSAATIEQAKTNILLIDVDSDRQYAPVFVNDCSVVPIHLAVRSGSTCSDPFQPLGEVFNFLDHWFKIAFVVDPAPSANHSK